MTILLSVFLGFCAVLQSALNRRMASGWGLAGPVFLNCLIFLFWGTTLYLVARSLPQSLPEFFRPRGELSQFRLWYLLPGTLGFCLVAGIPVAIYRIGAFKVFLILMSSQMVASLLWDATMEAKPITALRVGGALLGALGAGLVAFAE
jgi:transporter family-2 protein